MISITVYTRAALRDLDDTQRKQIPFATARALTQTAKRVQEELRAEMQRGFESASPYTARSQFVAPATKSNLQATVGIKDIKPARGRAPADIIKEHFSGESRGLKPIEKILRQRGILPPGWRVATGEGMATDRYGNPKLAAVNEMLGSLKSGFAVNSGRGKRAATVGYFVVNPARTATTAHFKEPGIYRRIQRSTDRAAIPVFVFIPRAQYRKRFDLPAIANNIVNREFDAIFRASLASATSR